jgi:hypothetical protein
MAGSPLKRQRKLGVRDEGGNLVRFPYLRPVSGRNGPRDWRAWSPAQKLQYLFGMSLDDIYEIMSWPIAELDPFRLSVRMQVTRVVFAIGLKPLLDGSLGREAPRERNRAAVLEELARQLGGAADCHVREKLGWPQFHATLPARPRDTRDTVTRGHKRVARGALQRRGPAGLLPEGERHRIRSLRTTPTLGAGMNVDQPETCIDPVDGADADVV